MVGYERFDTIRGKVVGYKEHGCLVRDNESGNVVFYYGNGTKGDQVQLSVKRINPETGRITWILESVIEYAGSAA